MDGMKTGKPARDVIGSADKQKQLSDALGIAQGEE